MNIDSEDKAWKALRPAARALRRRLFRSAGGASWIKTLPGFRPSLEIEGFCTACERSTRFVAWEAWLRESLHCMRCSSLPRERAFFSILAKVAPNWRALRIHEGSPSSLTNRLARECEQYVPTYFHPGTPLGEPIPGIGTRCEDLERQTFPDASFDLVITQDVFEHLLSPELAIAEIARTLVPGGLHIATVPLVRGDGPSAPRARRSAEGGIEHLAPREYHGNPITAEGSLVTYDWGKDIAAFFDREGLFSTEIVDSEDARLGILGGYTEVIVSTRI